MDLQKLINYFIHPRLQKVQVYSQAKTIVGAGIIASFAVPGFALIYYFLNHHTAAVMMGIFGLIVLGSLLLLKLVGRISLSREIIIASFYLLILWLTHSMNGIQSPSDYWFALIPLLAIYMGSYLPGIIWGIISCSTIAILYVLESANIPQPDSPVSNMVLLQSISIIGLTAVIFSLAVFYQTAKDQVFANLQKALSVIKQKTNELTKTNTNLRALSSALQATLESTTDGILVVDNLGRITNYNQHFLSMWQIPEELVASKDDSKLLYFMTNQVKEPEAFLAKIVELYNKPDKDSFDEIVFRDGRFFERYSLPQRLDNKVIGRVWNFRDVTKRKHAEKSLRFRDHAFAASAEGIVIFTAESDKYEIVYTNRAFEQITGLTSIEATGQNCLTILGGLENKESITKLKQAIAKHKEGREALLSYDKNGRIFWNDFHIAPVKDNDGIQEVGHYVGIINDITMHKRLELELDYQAKHDILTGLPNRTLLFEIIENNIKVSLATDSFFAILFCDFDRFKLINDSLGHNAGDILLKKAAQRFLNCICKEDVVARIGSDEFIIILNSISKPEDAAFIANNILKQLAKPFDIYNETLIVTCSIGISFYPTNGDDVATLLKNADTALYQAKRIQRNSFQIYHPQMNAKSLSLLTLETELRSALVNDEFRAYYQPLINLQNGMISGVEALLRWEHPRRGLVSPLEFIPLAEESELIVPIGEWVLRTACKQTKLWQQQGYKDLYIAVNLSAQQLKQKNFAAVIKDALENSKLAPEYLELEITESLLLDNVDNTINLLTELKSLGVKLVLDDFGTGYSNLAYLKQFPLDKIKIDQTLARHITTSEVDKAIIQAIVSMANSLHKSTLIEGIEQREQLELLKCYNIDEAQGYLFGKPMKAQTCQQLWVNRKSA